MCERTKHARACAVGVLLMALLGAAGAFAQAQIPLAGSAIPQFVDPLPDLDVIVATRGQPTEVRYVNNLGTTADTKVLAYKNSTDQTLHWADPLIDY